jgi:enoyl-CoA hydratase
VAVARSIEAVNAATLGDEGFAVEVEMFRACCGTEDMKEGVTAFLEKRKPIFPGR